MPDNLLGHALTPDPPRSFTRRNGLPEVSPASFSQTSKTALTQSGIGIVRVTGLSDEIDNGPVLFSLLKVGEVQLNGFMPPQATGE